MTGQFEIAAGSVTGREHWSARKNSHDAYQVIKDDNLIVAIICDGCGDPVTSPDSEVGAKIGAALVATMLYRYMTSFQPQSAEGVLERTRQDVLSYLRVLALQMGDSLSAVVSRYFLFTTVGAILSSSGATFFTLGDGIIIVNGEQMTVGPYPDNMPPYLAYGLVPTSLTQEAPGLLRFQIQRQVPIGEIESFLIGCDGVADLIAASEKQIPGTQETVGPISQFWQADSFFTTRTGLQKRLNRIAGDAMRRQQDGNVVRCPGLLGDDATLVVGRRAHPQLKEEAWAKQ